MVWWYFGDLAYRLNPMVWGKAGWRFLNAEFGSLALVGLAVTGWISSRSTLVRGWLLAGTITVLVFTHLILHHEHYYMIFSPLVAILCAGALQQLEIVLRQNWPKLTPWIAPAMAVLLALALVQGLMGTKALNPDQYPVRIARIIQEHTVPTDKILIQGGDWGGQELFLSDRKGLSIWDTGIAENTRDLNRLRELGYTKLVMINESPLLTSVRWVKPGQESPPRRTYREALTPVAEHWPTVLETQDILIKDIPKQ